VLSTIAKWHDVLDHELVLYAAVSAAMTERIKNRFPVIDRYDTRAAKRVLSKGALHAMSLRVPPHCPRLQRAQPTLTKSRHCLRQPWRTRVHARTIARHVLAPRAGL